MYLYDLSAQFLAEKPNILIISSLSLSLSLSLPPSLPPSLPLSLLPSHSFPYSPVRLLGGTTFRYMYCMIMGCWGANVIQDLFDKSVYYRSSNDLLDAFTYFGMSCIQYDQTSVYVFCQAQLHVPYFAL